MTFTDWLKLYGMSAATDIEGSQVVIVTAEHPGFKQLWQLDDAIVTARNRTAVFLRLKPQKETITPPKKPTRKERISNFASLILNTMGHSMRRKSR